MLCCWRCTSAVRACTRACSICPLFVCLVAGYHDKYNVPVPYAMLDNGEIAIYVSPLRANGISTYDNVYSETLEGSLERLSRNS